ncbi:SAM-dependent methyltransferase [Burkholderia vietnamiensis]|uniref:SAM-dependent methyltransferase n=1 Tax=Burkholderia vietnamiensis TaxID=60552 RepID=UPI001B9F9BD9|nr:SAM-dependent methyltransferase [Burkholderia vietnamiensis]MBR8193784.1 SAM-dependent methyltransferase [Burkholderia vietnamiensis]
MSQVASSLQISNAAVASLLQSATMQPVRGGQGIYLNLNRAHSEQIEARARLDRLMLLRCSETACCYVPVTDALAAAIADRSIYGALKVADDHHLELMEDGRLYVVYSQIIGSWQVGMVHPDVWAAALDHLATQLRAFAIPRLLAKGAAITDLDITDELGLLMNQGDRIALPTTQLRHYPAIKRMLEKVGGKYRKGGFDFEHGTDIVDILQRLRAGEDLNPIKDFQFFRSTAPVARRVCEAVNPTIGMRILEPSAGDGALADVLSAAGAEVTCVELWDRNAQLLRRKGYTVLEQDFLDLDPDTVGRFPAIVANPPFTKNQDIAHVSHMLKFLEPGGMLSTVMSTSWMQGSRRAQLAFRQLLEQLGAEVTPIEAGAFKESGTGIATLHVVIRSTASVSTPALGTATA